MAQECVAPFVVDTSGVCILESDLEARNAEEAAADAQMDIGTGLESAIKQCTGASGGISNILDSLSKTLGGSVGGAGGQAVSSAVGAVTGGASGAISGAVGSIGSAIVGGAENIIKDIGVYFGSQSIMDFGTSIGGLFGGGDIVSGAFGAIMGGGGLVPTNPVPIVSNIAAIKKKETCDDALAFYAAKMTQSRLISDMANYINTGNNGNPFYPKNLGDYYQNVANNQTKILLGQIQQSNSPYAGSVMPAIIKANQNETPDSFAKQTEYTLDKVAGGKDKAARYIQGDSNACPSYLRCLVSAAEPNNNVWGVYSASMNTLAERQAKAEDEAKTKLLSGSGFASAEKCVDERTNEETGDTYCMRWETETPGVLIAEQGKEVATNAIKEARSIDSAGEQVSPFFTRFANQILTGGLSVLSNFLKGGAASTIGSYNRSTRTQINSALGSAVENTIYYAAMLEGKSIPTATSIINDLNSISACYASVDRLLASGGNSQQQDKPASGEIANLANYQIILNGYQNTLNVINANPQTGTSDADLLGLSNEFEILKAKQTAIASYLSACQNQARSLGIEQQNKTTGSGGSGSD